MNPNWTYGILDDAVIKGSSNISLNKIKNDVGEFPVYGAKGFVQNISFYQQEKPYLAIIKDGAGIGRVSKHPEKSSVLATMQYINPRQGYDIDFMKYFLRHIDFEKYRTGSTIPHVYYKDYKVESFPLIALEEQKQIVAVLDKAFAAIDQAKANVEKNLQNAKELFQSKLNEIFTQKGEGWEEKSVGEISDHRLGKMLDKRKNKGGFEPYLRNLNVQWFNVDLSDVQEMRFEQDEYERYSVKKGDLLICEGGYPGRAAIWQNTETMFFQKALHRVRSHEPLHNEWLLYFLYLSDMTGALRTHFTGTGIQHLTGQSLKKFKLPIAPKLDMSKLLKEINSMFEKNKQIEAIYQQKIDALEELKKSILQKAFAGGF